MVHNLEGVCRGYGSQLAHCVESKDGCDNDRCQVKTVNYSKAAVAYHARFGIISTTNQNSRVESEKESDYEEEYVDNGPTASIRISFCIAFDIVARIAKIIHQFLSLFHI